ncbi:chymotrypsin-like elastase family member 2A [Gigantopelta aegis]|uniref:chymotrypsin-like elastase family member 2A n=1 Tax=Gigantopelta aegis TaxID=1735272 RepID=UPI001B88C18F|nr:chymotrypsin-like elastase family member 2A [Gigantopelta aegis]
MIIAGDWDHLKRDYYGGVLSEQYFRVESWALHPDYPNVTSLNDINVLFLQKGETGFHANGFVIVKLNQPIKYTSCVRPACLTNQINDMSRSPCGISDCMMTGWGNSENGDLKDFLQQARLNMPNVETCEAIEYYGAKLESLPAKTTCAVSPARPRAFHCVGDQGGPVVCKGSDGRWTLRGSVLARLLCDSGKPVPVADVTQVMDWVNETIRNL